MVASLLFDYSFDSPDFIWENITPRQAGYLMEHATKRQARRDLRLLGIFHAEKPQDLHADLKEAAMGNPKAKDPEMANLDSALAMARLMGDEEAVERIMRHKRRLPKLRAAMAYMARQN